MIWIRRIANLLLLATAASCTTAASLKNCNTSSLFQMLTSSLTPTTPSPGQEVVLSLEYTIPEGLVVTSGQSVYQITFNFVPLNPTVTPLCQDIPCPLGPGTYSNATKSAWPSGVSGSFTSTMRWNGEGIASADENYLCLQISGKV